TFTYGYQYADPAVRIGRTYTSENIKQGVPFNNSGGYSNPEVDKLFAEGATEVDENKRREIYARIQSILYEDLPVLWLMEMKFVTITNVRVHDLIKTGTGVVSSFSDAYYEYPSPSRMRSSRRDMRMIRIATLGPPGSNHEKATKAYLRFHDLPGAEVSYFETYTQALEMLRSGEIDFFTQVCAHPEVAI